MQPDSIQVPAFQVALLAIYDCGFKDGQTKMQAQLDSLQQLLIAMPPSTGLSPASFILGFIVATIATLLVGTAIINGVTRRSL